MPRICPLCGKNFFIRNKCFLCGKYVCGKCATNFDFHEDISFDTDGNACEGDDVSLIFMYKYLSSLPVPNNNFISCRKCADKIYASWKEWQDKIFPSLEQIKAIETFPITYHGKMPIESGSTRSDCVFRHKVDSHSGKVDSHSAES